MPLVQVQVLMAARRRRDAELALLTLDATHAAVAPLTGMVKDGDKVLKAALGRLKAALRYGVRDEEAERNAQIDATFAKMLALAEKQAADAAAQCPPPPPPPRSS